MMLNADIEFKGNVIGFGTGERIVLPSGRPSPLQRAIPPGHIHLGIAKEIVAIVREFGLDPEPLVRAAALDLRQFEDGTTIVSYSAVARLYTLCVSRTGCPHFGLLVGRRATILSMGLIGRLMQHSETVGEALEGLVVNLSVQDRSLIGSLTVGNGVALLSYAAHRPQTESGEQITDAALAVSVNALRTLCGPEWRPIEVLVPRAPLGDIEPYRRHFRAPVRFNQECATLIFPVEDLKRRIATADPLLREVLDNHMRRTRAEAGSDFSDEIRRVLRVQLTSTRCLATDMAALMAMHRRTLSRRLKGSGQGYRSMTNEVRFEIARQLLEDTEVPLGEIAAALGYSEASAFTRAFRRWSGRTPKAWRGDGRPG